MVGSRDNEFGTRGFWEICEGYGDFGSEKGKLGFLCNFFSNIKLTHKHKMDKEGVTRSHLLVLEVKRQP